MQEACSGEQGCEVGGACGSVLSLCSVGSWSSGPVGPWETMGTIIAIISPEGQEAEPFTNRLPARHGWRVLLGTLALWHLCPTQ